MFNLFERSRNHGKPFYLLFIQYGSGPTEFFTFTDCEVPVTKDGLEYAVSAFDLGEVTATGTLDNSTMELRTPRSNELFELFRIYPPSTRVSMFVMKGHYGDTTPTFATIWSGRIVNMVVRGSECTFVCEPIITTLKRLGLRRHWQYGCPHSLYQHGCRASKTRVRQSVEIVSIDKTTMTLRPGWNGSLPPEKYIGGYVEIPGATVATRTILRVTGNDLLLAGSLSLASAGMLVGVLPGCAHDMADCKAVHDNILNFGGQPWIPSDNPVGSKNNFY